MISVIIPTINRPEMVLNCVLSLYASSNKVNAIVVIDESEKTLELLKQTPAKIGFNATRKGAIECWNIGLKEAKDDFIVFAGDDLLWRPGWVEAALYCHATQLKGYGMVGLNDEHNPEPWCTHYMADRKFIKEVFGGRIAFPIFQFGYNDTAAIALAKRNYMWCGEARVPHQHPANGRRVADEVDALHGEHWVHDADAYNAWAARGRKIEWEPVI